MEDCLKANKESKEKVHLVPFHFHKTLENVNQSTVTENRSVIAGNEGGEEKELQRGLRELMR